MFRTELNGGMSEEVERGVESVMRLSGGWFMSDRSQIGIPFLKQGMNFSSVISNLQKS